MNLIVRSMQIVFVLSLFAPSISFAQSACGSLLNPRPFKADPVLEVKRALVKLQLISHASVRHYRDASGEKLITVFYDKNRADIVTKKNRIVELEQEDGSILKAYPYTRDQAEALSDNIQKLSEHAIIAVVDPYAHQPTIKETNQYGLYDLARKTVTVRDGLREPSPIAKVESVRGANARAVEFINARKVARGIAYGAGFIGLLTLSEPQIAYPLLISAYGLSLHSNFSAAKNIRKTHYFEQAQLSRELTEKVLPEADRIVLIVPDFVRKDLEQHLDQNFEALD